MSDLASMFTPMITPNATRGTTNCKIAFVCFVNLNALIAPVHRPIIKLPQYTEIYFADSEADIDPNAFCFNNSPRLLPMATSTPTYTNMASMPSTNCGYCMAPHPAGFDFAATFENINPNTTAASAPSNHRILYNSNGCFNSSILAFSVLMPL